MTLFELIGQPLPLVAKSPNTTDTKKTVLAAGVEVAVREIQVPRLVAVIVALRRRPIVSTCQLGSTKSLEHGIQGRPVPVDVG